MSPPLNELSRLLLSSDQAAVKLAPATDAPPDWSAACELEWIGSRGECRQQVAWFGSLARHTGRRSATIIARDAEARTIVGDAHHILPPPAKIGRFLYEPHAAVLAAGLTGVVCELHGLAPIASGVAYLTGEKTAYDAAMDAFEVRDVLPLDRKQLRAYCREHRLARLEIKKRGVDVEPQRLRQEIVGEGDEETVLLIAPIGEHVRAIVARRLRNAYGSALQ